jgi:5'-nucleotidase
MICRRFFSLILAFCLFSSCSRVERAKAPNLERFEHLVIIGTNDFHGYLRTTETDFFGSNVIAGGAEWFASYAKILRNKYGENLLLLDGGDLFQGTLESNTFRGEPVMEFYNEAGYQAAAIGNHEFDYGPLRPGGKDTLGALKARMRQAKFPFLTANVFLKGTQQHWREKNLFPSAQMTVKGIHIGIVGLTTETAPFKTRPQNVKKLEFRPLLKSLEDEATHLRQNGAELVFVVVHEGEAPLFEVLEKLPSGMVDAVVAGHTHTAINKVVNDIPVIEAKTRGFFFGRIDLFVDRQTHKIDKDLTKISPLTAICGTWFKNSEACDPKEALDQIASGKAKKEDFLPLRPATIERVVVTRDVGLAQRLQPYFTKVEHLKRKVLGTASRDFQFFPSGETEVGQLFTDVLRKKFPEVKVVYLNGGGFRRMLLAGPITYGDLFEVSPFENDVVLVKIHGRDLRKMLQIGTSGFGHMRIPAVAGVKFSYHAADIDKALKWRRNRLLSLNWDDGRPVCDEDEFWMATLNYLVEGGDNMDDVFGQIPPRDVHNKAVNVRDLVAQYILKHEGALPQITQKRITLLPYDEKMPMSHSSNCKK